MKKFPKYLTVALAIAALTLSAARAELIYGVTAEAAGVAPRLISFDSANPAGFSIIGSTGVPTLRAIDFRPANGLLYGLSFDTGSLSAQLYTIDLSTGASTPLFAPITLSGATASTRVSIDFNPVPDRIRVVTANGSSYRINPDTGGLTMDTAFAYAAGDINAGTAPFIVGVAYTNNVPGATSTTLYTYDFAIDSIARVGSPGGSPDSPNNGQMTTIGAFGDTAFNGALGFDISGVTGVAYAVFDETNSATGGFEFYTVDLATGMGTLVAGEIPIGLLDISAAPVPEPGTIALAAIGALGLVVAARRRRTLAAK